MYTIRGPPSAFENIVLNSDSNDSNQGCTVLPTTPYVTVVVHEVITFGSRTSLVTSWLMFHYFVSVVFSYTISTTAVAWVGCLVPLLMYQYKINNTWNNVSQNVICWLVQEPEMFGLYTGTCVGQALCHGLTANCLLVVCISRIAAARALFRATTLY